MSVSRNLLLLAIGFALTGCPSPNDVEVTEEGWLQRGTEVARDTTQRTVGLGERPLTIDIARGSVTISGADVEEAELEFERVARAGSPAAAAERLDRIEIREEGDTDRYQITVPPDRRQAAEVHLRARIPHSTPVRVRLARGEVALSQLEGDVDVQNTNGNVEASALRSPQVRVRTTRGNQRIAFAVFERGHDLNLRAENGDLEIVLPPTGSADISAETGVGGIGVGELPLSRERFEEGRVDTRYRARLGEGRGRVVAVTGVGDIRLRAGQEAGIEVPANAGPMPAEAPVNRAAPDAGGDG